ncbi:hypothetical protein DAEQUDRAFT_671296 [Daedalea quercina L-15889]|uniref:UvrD-like helicase ATP-binding domain-containing protein n=1 Tax=Daedalea quercina L-15889 TaxID=1314783 RepID=A0A165PNP2_9APHY|nr:hypothetical protein DAEQUDRAFT_671296 [Daedalea quercina L-15889]
MQLICIVNIQYFLHVFRDPHLREAIRRAYVIDGDSTQDASTSHGSTSGTLVQSNVVATETPSAHPFVQPIKAALYFDSVDGFGEWRILISTSAQTDLRRMQKRSAELFRITLKKIKELSQGNFSPDNQKLLNQGAEIPIYEAKMTGDSRLVYQIDCVPEFQMNTVLHIVAIRIFGIYTHAQLSRQPWDTIGNELGRTGKEYKSREVMKACIFRNRPTRVGGRTGTTVLPASWPALAENDDDTAGTLSYALPGSHQDDLEKVSLNDCRRSELEVSTLHLGILADHDVMHVFAVSPQEKEIIEHPRSCYVLGRSGTGKTTTMLFKILGIERSWQACEGALVKPRQLFVTQSRVLAEKVQEFFTELHASLLTADKSPEELKRMASARRFQQDDVMVDKDEEVELGRGDLPRRYSELTDEHFPMFVTFDQLCRLLEAEPTHSVSVQQLSPPQADTEISNDDTVDLPPNDYMEQRRDSFVSYGAFLDSYWAHFPQQVTKHLDPALVFSEIIGSLIKGSEQSLKSKDGYLDRSSYLKLSRRTQATFATQRDQIYDLFLEYLKHKRRRGDYDAADRTRRILNTIQSCGVPGKQVDFLYVDEAQDNMLIDALLLRSLTSNSDIGLFWAGDTAQTISIGSAFRFNDLKAFLHRIDSEASLIHPGRQPTTFQLAVNYRSHAGIVNCAHSVIELITTFWPHAIDRLAPEHGRIEGKKPLFLSEWDEDTMRYEQFLFGDSVSHLEFGAHQCILVRDDAARRKLRSQVGKIGIILTVYESKGLEFDDVLLFNFFADSTVGLSQWRVILNALPNEKTAVSKAPAFDNNRHNGVCRELKFLYVAITRARKNLWIADDSGRCGPMRDYWDAKGHVEHWTPTSSKDVPRLAVSSTPEQWAKTASMLFKNKRYSQAMHSYEQANLPNDRDTAEAYYLREKARTARTKSRTDNSARASAYTKAAEAFRKSAHQTMKEEQKLAHFRIAAECHIQAGDVVRAAQAYLLAQEFTLSANLYRRAGLFDDAVSVIKGHRNSIDPRVVQTIMDVSRLEYLRKRNIKRARALFDSDEDALEYMDDRGLDPARAALLEQLGRFSDAAQVHLDEGRTLEAIPLFLRDRQNPHAHERASYCLLDGLRRRLSFGINPSQVAQLDHVLQELCHILCSQDVVTANLSAAIQDEMFRAIISNDVQQLFKLSEHFRHWHKDNICALRCLDHGFLTMPKLDIASLPVIAESLHHFSAYVDFLRMYASATDLCDNEGMRRLFAFQIASEDFFLVPKDTFLYGRCVRPGPRPGPRYSYRPSDQGALLPKDELNRLLRHALQERLRQKVHDENVLCRRTRAFQVCLHFFTSSKCNRVECPQDHLAAENHNTGSYNLRIRVLLQQILVYNSVHAFENRGEQAQQRVYWLHLLYEALNPPSFKMGTVYSLRPPTIPEYNDGLQIVRHWLFDWLYDITPYSEIGHLVREFLTALLQTTSLGLTFDAGALQYHLPLVQSVSVYRPTEALSRGEEKVYIMQDLERYVRNEHQASLASGILFVNHILTKRLPVDISALCDFLDVLCGRLVVASRLGHRNTMHDVTLPRSWLLRALPSLYELKDKSTNLFELYVTPMADLLEQIYNPVNAEHLLLESRGVRNISSLGFPMRNVFLARICRNVCLLGYNSRYQWLREKIHCTITSLQRPGREFNRVYSHYVNALNWEALAREVRDHSTSGSPFDKMVQLYHAKMGEPRFPPRRSVRRIIYNDVDEILVLLDPDAALGRSPSLNKDAAPFVPPQLHVPAQRDGASIVAADEPAEDEPAEDEPAEDEQEHDLPEADDEEDADATPPVVDLNDESLAFDAPDPAAEQRAREKLDAAQVIAEAYRRYARHRGTQYTTPATVIHLRFVEAYRAVYGSRGSMGTREERYRVLLLVPLPHAMVFLELARNHLYDKKNELKKRLKIVEHLELEEVNNKITQNNEQLKDAIRLIKVLEPRAAVHERQDYEGLRARMREVEQLAGGLPSNVTADWDFYLKTAVAGILSQKPQPTKKPKPELNLMDDDMVDYESIEYADDE